MTPFTKALIVLFASMVVGSWEWLPLRVLGTLLFWYSIWLFVKAYRSRDGGETKRKFDELVAAQPRVDYQDFFKGGSVWFGQAPHASGIAIDLTNQILILASAGNARAYPFDSVRGWEGTIVKASQVIGANLGVMDGVRVGAHNAGAQIQALRETGLFVRVRDVDHPVWQVYMMRAEPQRRWIEILDQAFEHRAAAAE